MYNDLLLLSALATAIYSIIISAVIMIRLLMGNPWGFAEEAGLITMVLVIVIWVAGRLYAGDPLPDHVVVPSEEDEDD